MTLAPTPGGTNCDRRFDCGREALWSSAGCCAHKPVTAPATFSQKGKRHSKPKGKFTVVDQARLIGSC
jgi:hypothetical protein